MFNQQQIYLFCQIQTSQTGGQPYSDTSPYEVSECSLFSVTVGNLYSRKIYELNYYQKCYEKVRMFRITWPW